MKALFLIALLGEALAHAATAEIKAMGNQLVTVAGNCPVTLKGVNIASMEWTNTGDGPSGNILTTVQTSVNNWGCNVVRIPLNQDRWFGLGGCGAVAATYQGIVDNIVNWCNANNAWVMLDLHWSDTGTWGGGNVCSGGQHDMPDSNSAAFWTDVAARYANNPAVLFDLYNEPGGAPCCSTLSADSAGWTRWHDGGTTWGEGTYTSPGMQSLVNTVRATGAKNLIVAGGRDWAYDLRGITAYSKQLTDATGNGVAYATHIYPWKPTPWDTFIPASVLAAYPVLVTEFGQNSGDPAGWAHSVVTWAQSKGIGFIAWDMHTAASPCLISDWSFTPTSWFGVPVKADLLATSGGGCSGTPTFSATPTLQQSPTFTPTRSWTASPPSSSTFSPSATPSPTISPPASGTATPSAAQSSTQTYTQVPAGNTETFTPSITPSVSVSASKTSSPSSTATETAPPTASPSGTASPSATGSESPTLTPGPAALPSATVSPTLVPGQSRLQPAQGGEGPEILALNGFPSPASSRLAWAAVRLKGSADRFRVDLFSTGMTLMDSQTLTQAAGPGSNLLAVDLSRCAAGALYLRVLAEGRGKSSQGTAKWYYLP